MPDVEATCRRCGHTWETTATRSTAYLYRVSDSWWHKPRQLLTLPLRFRTWQPNPALYFGSAVAGTAVGSLLDVLWGVPWWVLTVAGPVGVLVASVVSGIRRSGTRSFRMQLLSVLSPARHRERQLEEQARLVRETDLPLYMLADAEGWFRHVGRMSHSDDQLSGLSLSHERQDDANGGLHLNVRAHGVGIDAVSLVSMQDVHSYLNGARQLRKRHYGFCQHSDPGLNIA